MSKYIEMKGLKFDRLLVIDKDMNKPTSHCLCICDCGNKVSIARGHLNSGHTTSCGCKPKDTPNNLQHGKTKTVGYNSWLSMKSRCNNPNNQDYYNYGNRGITVSEEWNNSFEQFYDDMGNRPSKDYSLDRIDTNKGYSKENCKWSTLIEQANNKNNNIKVSLNDVEFTLLELSDKCGLSYDVIYQRHIKGFKNEQLIKPLNSNRKTNKLVVYQGKSYSIKDLSNLLNISNTIILNRLHKGWNPDNLGQLVGTRNKLQTNTTKQCL